MKMVEISYQTCLIICSSGHTKWQVLYDCNNCLVSHLGSKYINFRLTNKLEEFDLKSCQS